jgi:hypothetical protein
LKWIAAAFLGIFLGIQLVPVERGNPPVEAETPAPEHVRSILQRSCYDCHSNETRWPWYAYVAPISWQVAQDVSEAREKLNFSTWNAYSAKKRATRFKNISKEIKKEKMPLGNYLWLHPDARLAPDEAAALEDWAASSIAAPAAEAPAPAAEPDSQR